MQLGFPVEKRVNSYLAKRNQAPSMANKQALCPVVPFSGSQKSKLSKISKVSNDEFILVTGGAGYIGSHFVNEYLMQKPACQKVVVLDDLSEGHLGAIQALKKRYPGRIRFVKAKVGDGKVQGLMGRFKVKAIVHFAASASVSESQEDPMKYLDNNVSQTIQLLKSALNKGVKRFVFSSTAAVYGNPTEVPIVETSPTRPINNYGASKLNMEQSLAQLKEAGKMDYVALRYFNAAGADEAGKLGEAHRNESHLIPLVLQVAKGQKRAIQQFGNDYNTPDGTCIRDYIHIQDLADAHIKALNYLEQHPNTGLALNLGTGTGNSVREVIEACRTITGKPIQVEQAPRREGDPDRLVASYDQAQKTLGWAPRHDLNQIIKTAWQWEQSPRFQAKPSWLNRLQALFKTEKHLKSSYNMRNTDFHQAN
ncbi:UDP-glucose 4-epimerase GalE [Vampirovibrio sp.]|uniref:UDP-glucose 4-epimerase GalE n=1 Tax=Vampirovibrio sp. TaxID=2717857 RepID=UPI0035944270